VEGEADLTIVNAGLLVRGIVLGLSIAAPVGPIGVLCIRRTLAEGRAHGLVSGLGAATADAIYGCIAAFGLAFVTDLLVGQQTWLRLIGGAFLVYLGIKTLLSAVAEEAAVAQGRGLAAAYVSTLALTLTNPMTILSFVAVFAGMGLPEGEMGSAGVLVLGVFLGSALWWLLLSGAVGVLRHRLDSGVLRWVNRVSGAVIAGFGVAALLGLLLRR
jgi:threonine/homoserine/homoserine lactone efflux protein